MNKNALIDEGKLVDIYIKNDTIKMWWETIKFISELYYMFK